MKCNICGKEFEIRYDGKPSGMTFVTADGLLTVCADCIVDMSRRTTKEVKYYDEDEKVWKIGSVIVDERSNKEV